MDNNPSKPNEPTFAYEAWRKRFDQLLTEDQRAAQNMNRLVNLGLDKERFVLLLPLACDFDGSPGYEAFQVILDTAAEVAKKVERLSRLQKKFRKEAVEFLKSNEFKEMLNTLDAFGDYLESIGAEMHQIGSRRSQIPEMFLSWVITDVKAKTGKPHYREVCDLLEIAYSAYEQAVPETGIGPDAMRKQVKRFMKIDPVPWFFNEQELASFFLTLFVGALLQEFTQSTYFST
jgi:hypothetical protein